MTPQHQKTKNSLKTPKNGLKTNVADYGEVITKSMGGLKLKRRMLNGEPYRANVYLSPDTFTFLTSIGIKTGVTWDEALRGILELHKASGDPVTALRLFIPALN